jgi:hypothetical protein
MSQHIWQVAVENQGEFSDDFAHVLSILLSGFRLQRQAVPKL